MSTHKHARSPLLATLALATVAFLAGSVVTGAVATHISLKQVREVAAAADRSAARAKLLEGLLAQQTAEAASLASPPVAAPAPAPESQPHAEPTKSETTPSPKPAEPARTKGATAARDSAKPSQAAATRPSTASKDATPKAPPTPPAASPKIQAAATPALSPVQSEQVKTNALMTSDAVVAARDKNKIEAIPASALGVVKLTSDGVELKNGRIVPIGGTFPSGDRLLATDVENGQIVTDRRTILVL